jgi:biotin synthase
MLHHNDISQVLKSDAASWSREQLASLLRLEDAASIEMVRAAAEQTLLDHCGSAVYYRGLIEFSNHCALNCYYCGIRRDTPGIMRYQLDKGEIVDAALWCAQSGYGSMVLQSGERSDEPFVDFVEDAVRTIKQQTISERLPRGLGITLCVGEQSPAVYQRFFDAGAHRYLLRIETTNPELFARIHPPRQTLQKRMACLHSLQEIGYQVGTGVMIGLPGQSAEMLADDLLFFKSFDLDMVGMGPYLVHDATPMASWDQPLPSTEQRLRLGLLMIALTRLVLKDVNIAATTALQTIHPTGRELGLQYGANVIMPQLTPLDYRSAYQLYEGKPCMDEDKSECRSCLQRRVESVGRTVAFDVWGDSKHFSRRNQ